MHPVIAKLLSFFVSIFILASAVSLRAAEQVTISEFLASNTIGLKDEDGQFGDWIELRNSGPSAVNLDGWFLTDSANNLTKWRIPATNITAGGFLVIFADSKDRAIPGRTLHTSFNLSASGEYLALVKPDGVTIATQFSPAFPGQAPDVSYGFASFTTNLTAITSNSPVRWRIPNGTEGTNWLATNYNDSGWAVGTNGVGYGNFASANYAQAILPTAPVLYYRLDETSGNTAANLGSGGAAGTYTSVTLGTAGPRPPTFNGFEANNNAPTFNGSSSFVAGPASLLSGRSAFTVGGWIYPTATPAARTGLFGQNDCVEFGFITGTTLECWTPNGGSATGVPYPYPLNQWHHVVGVADGSTIRIYLDGVLASPTGGTATANYGSSAFNFNIGGGGVQDATGNFFPGLIDEVVVYHRALSAAEVLSLYQAGTISAGGSGSSSLVQADVGAAMSNINASAYVRIPFVVTNATNISLISLRMRYNDGFVASINGTEVVRINAPETPVFNSTATNVHASLTSEEFRLGSASLLTGTNVLAIQGLNVAANDTNFFIGAEMVLTSVEADSSTPVFFTTPTPGAANFGGILNPGPSIVNPSNYPAVPLDSQDLIITAKVVPTFYPISNVVMYYRVMFDPSNAVTMFDDGLHGDGAAADGVYGATIPESASTNGQMVRWYFRATDIRGNVSRWPIFANPAASEEYLGTVVNPNYVTSSLPIFQLFAAPGVLQTPRLTPVTTQTGADGEAGGRLAIFYDGEFYDNVYMELRGNTSAGQNKKSHRLEFNREHPFRHLPQFPRIRKTSLMAEFLDPTYLRQHLSFWLLEQMGEPSPFFYPVRAQLNGQFYGLVFHNDVIGQEQVERMGFDPKGALYKAAGNVLISRSSTGVFQKLEPDGPPDYTDYNQLCNGIVETASITNRRIAAYDMLDVPEVINYLAGARWNAENDDVWANMSLYRDTYGDQLWRIIPFDMNASWGQRYGGITPLDAIADTCKSHPLYGGSTIIACDGSTYNRMYDLIIALPETREMLLRRMRTILDRWVMEPGVAPASRLLETHIQYMTNLIWTEAFLDRASWGYSTWTASNKPLTNGINELFNEFINLRRNHFSATHSVTNSAKPIGIQRTDNAGIPVSQPQNATILIGQIESNPSSGNQGHEFIQLTNPNPFAVDISGWKLDGGAEFRFKPGTVINANGALYLTPDLKAFRTRTTTPRPGQGLYVIGNYQGTLDARGEPLVLMDDIGRIVHTNSYPPSPSAAQNYLRITEIMYHPGPTNAACPYAQEDFEYIEFKNIGPSPLNLTGVHFTNGVDFAFTNLNFNPLPPGQVVVIVKNPAAFICRYGLDASTRIIGTFGGSLDNAGERIKLDDAVGEQILDFSYNNSWYRMTDGNGFSLVIINENAPWDTWNLKESWRPSAGYNGSAGTNDPAPVLSAPILVNEVLANSDFPAVDAIELYNPTTNPVDVGNWWLSDDFYTPRKYRIPAPTVIAAGGYRTFSESDFNNPPTGSNSFAFSSAGDEAYVFAGDAGGNITGYFDGFAFNASEPGVSFGRYVTSETNVHYVAQKALTLSATNAGPKVGPIVISEIMYHPPDIAALDNNLDEFIELQNISSNAAPLYDLAFPTNRWHLDDAVDFTFGTNTIPAGGFLVVVSFNPTNTAQLTAFRNTYRISTNVTIVGPFLHELDNSGESVELKKPDTSVPTNITSVLVERVHYHDSPPWDSFADGFGASLQRIVAKDYGDDPTNWAGTYPNPGSGYVGGTRPTITSHPTNTIAVAGRGTNTFTVVATGPGLQYQWRANGTNIPGATNSTLVLVSVDLTQAGDYQAIVFNGAGGAFSSNAHLTVLSPVMFISQPFTTNAVVGSVASVLPGTNVTLTAFAVGNGPVRYQWQFEGVNIAGATNANYTFTNAVIPNQGNYSVIAMDDISVTVSSNVFVWVLVRPGYVQQPQNVTVLQGQTAIFSVVVTGSPPIFYRWIRGGTPVLTSSVPVLVLTNVQFGGSIRVAATNIATGLGGVNSSTVQLTVLADFDGDGMADIWEVQYGFNTNNAADAFLDFDGDGVINRDEYIAGTDPTNPGDPLKLVVTATNSAVLRFVAQTNTGYTVQYRTNLTSASWSNFTNFSPQTLASTVLVTVPYPPPEPARFYRIVTPIPILP